MIPVSNNFKAAIKQPIKRLSGYIETSEGIKITSEDDLVDFKISAEGGLCKAVMRKLEVKILGHSDLLDQWLKVYLGVVMPDKKVEYICYGSFLVKEVSSIKNNDTVTLVCYDNMIRLRDLYKPVFEYPLTVKSYVETILGLYGLELATPNFVHNDLPITIDLYSNIDGCTWWDILVQIAQISGTIAMFGVDDKLYFKELYDTGEQITYDNLMKLKVETKYGPINSVILSRQPQEDNIFISDSDSITANGLTEFKISNNEIVDKRREETLPAIFNVLNGIEYFPFEADTEGLGWFEIGDKVKIENSAGTWYDSVITAVTLHMTGALKEKLVATPSAYTETVYSRAGEVVRRIKNTEIVVDKQQQYIQSIVSDLDEFNDQFTSIYQDITNITNAVQFTGGSNLLRNSVMFAFDNDGIPFDWAVSGAGTLRIFSSGEARNSGSLSGHVFELNDKKVVQRVVVRVDDDTIPENQKTYYSFSCKVKKDLAGTGYIKIYNANESHLIEFPNGTGSLYGDFYLAELLPTSNYYDIEIYGSANSNLTITDAMFAVGKFRTPWQQASGEIMNTEIQFSLNGIVVRSSVFAGDYTIMSPLEFAGYSKINGVNTKVFTINKDVTEVKKLRANDEISMPPIKIVPIKQGAVTGWAFVSRTD